MSIRVSVQSLKMLFSVILLAAGLTVVASSQYSCPEEFELKSLHSIQKCLLIPRYEQKMYRARLIFFC